MTAVLNNENKAKFFALYWGQKIKIAVRKDGEWELRVGEDVPGFNSSTITQYLELKPLSRITDEDLISVASIVFDPFYEGLRTIKIGKEIVSYIFKDANGNGYQKHAPQIADYLRSKGYALPYMGLTVEEMESAGWLKLQRNDSRRRKILLGSKK